MKAKLLLPQPVLPKAFGPASDAWPAYRFTKRHVVAPTGTIVDDRECWRLVQAGNCEPYDDECREECEMRGIDITPRAIAARLKKYKRLEAGKFTGDPRFDAK